MSAAPKWAPDVIRLRVAFAGECRVCHLPIENGSKAWRFTWSEGRGQGHETCGYYATDGDTDDDKDAVACMRSFLALKPSAVVPKSLCDEARGLGLVTRIERLNDVTISPTPLGEALMKLLRGSR